MQGGGFSGTCGTCCQDQSVGLKDCFFEDRYISAAEAHILQFHGAGIGQYPQRGRFKTPCGGKGSQPQLKRSDPFSFELDFSVLGQSLFSNIQARHDFNPRKHTPGHADGHFHIVAANPVRSKTNLSFFGSSGGLDMNIRRIIPEGSHDHLVNQFNHFTGRFIQRIFDLVFFLFFKADKRNHVHFLEHVFIGCCGVFYKEMLNKPLNILPDTHRKLDSAGFHQSGNLIYFSEVPGIIDENFQTLFTPA